MKRRDFTLALAALPLAACATSRAPRDDDPLVFAYFTTGKAGEAAGLKLAVSDDGFTFRTLAGGRSLLAPQVGERKLLRDPFLFRDIEKRGRGSAQLDSLARLLEVDG